MKLEQESLKPIYVQIAEGIEDDILNGILQVDEVAYSQYQIAKQFNVNPATAAKGINLLVAEGILYKKRGLGMHVALESMELIQDKRKKNFLSSLLKDIMLEAKKLGITKNEIKKMVDEYEGGEEN